MKQASLAPCPSASRPSDSYFAASARKTKQELQSQRKYDQELMDDFQALRDIDDPMIPLRASRIERLAVQNLLYEIRRQKVHSSICR